MIAVVAGTAAPCEPPRRGPETRNVPRLFVALQLPDSLKRDVGELQSGLRSARWLDEDALHLTLAFIGEVDVSAMRRIEDALATVTAPVLGVELRGIGCFPPRGAPRVLWTGASPKDELVLLAATVRRALGRAGVALERRRFMPHVTIARFRRPPSPAEMKRFLGSHSLFRTPRVDIAAFHLFSSVLRSSGARYTIEATMPLTTVAHGQPDPGRESPGTNAAGETGCGGATANTYEPAGEHEP